MLRDPQGLNSSSLVCRGYISCTHGDDLHGYPFALHSVFKRLFVDCPGPCRDWRRSDAHCSHSMFGTSALSSVS